jgi:hypothetical protein
MIFKTCLVKKQRNYNFVIVSCNIRLVKEENIFFFVLKEECVIFFYRSLKINKGMQYFLLWSSKYCHDPMQFPIQPLLTPVVTGMSDCRRGLDW